MIRRGLQLLVLLPAAALLIAFALANRDPVIVSFDPIGDPPAWAATLPIFVLVFAVLLAGVLVGGVAAWLNQGKWRRRARREEAEAKRWRARAEELVRDAEAARAERPREVAPVERHDA